MSQNSGWQESGFYRKGTVEAITQTLSDSRKSKLKRKTTGLPDMEKDTGKNLSHYSSETLGVFQGP